jgi:hypothetical protein
MTCGEIRDNTLMRAGVALAFVTVGHGHRSLSRTSGAVDGRPAGRSDSKAVRRNNPYALTVGSKTGHLGNLNQETFVAAIVRG